VANYPDAAPLLRRRKRKDGEVVWDATEAFGPCMQRAADFLRRTLAGPAADGIRRFFLDGDEEPREER
jgi:hypothetical protein